MAIIQNGINGGFTGKAGSVSGYNLNGKWIIRGMRKLSKKNKKGTVKQNVSRNAFTKMQRFLSPLLIFIRIGFNVESKKRMMTAHNVAKSVNMLNAQGPEGEIDCSKVCLSYGNLAGPKDAKIAVDDMGVHFSWDPQRSMGFERSRDQAIVIVYDVEGRGAYGETSGAKRSKGAETIELPPHDKGKTFHTWISIISENREDISMSKYCGSFVF